MTFDQCIDDDVDNDDDGDFTKRRCEKLNGRFENQEAKVGNNLHGKKAGIDILWLKFRSG